jgi:putative oxidoreductase
MLRTAATLVARPLIAWSFVTGGAAALKTPGPLVGLARQVGVPAPDVAVPVASAAMAVAGTTMSLGIRPRTSAVVLAGCLTGLTYTLHGYWRDKDPKARQ